MASYSGLPTRDYFNQILNEIICVDSFLLFITTISFKLQTRNCHCSPNTQKENLITFILT